MKRHEMVRSPVIDHNDGTVRWRQIQSYLESGGIRWRERSSSLRQFIFSSWVYPTSIQRHAWVDFFVWLRERGHAGVFVHGFLSLGFGSMILAFHNVWSGLPSVLTIVGCAYTLKAALCFLVPATQMRSLGRVSHERAWELAVPGFIFVGLGAVLTISLWTR